MLRADWRFGLWRCRRGLGELVCGAGWLVFLKKKRVVVGEEELDRGACQDFQERGSEPVNLSTTGPSYTIVPSIVSNPMNGASVGRIGSTPLKVVDRIPVGGGSCADARAIPPQRGNSWHAFVNKNLSFCSKQTLQSERFKKSKPFP
jgi:hypothetical protein